MTGGKRFKITETCRMPEPTEKSPWTGVVPDKKPILSGPKWFQTYSGLQFQPLNPDPATINIDDIAHSLSQVCRFGGHCREFYSVAQHSVYVMEYLSAAVASNPLLLLQALIHDATESYIGDMVRPLKCQIPAFEEVEANLNRVTHYALGVPFPDAEAKRRIKQADDCVLLAERRDLINHLDIPWSVSGTAAYFDIVPLSAKDAEQLFLWHWRQLF